MSFAQLIVYGTAEIDKLKEMGEQYQRDTEGKSKARRVIICADRDTPGRYVTFAEFDSVEDAEANNALPETQAFAAEMNKLAEGPVAYHNLDVIALYET